MRYGLERVPAKLTQYNEQCHSISISWRQPFGPVSHRSIAGSILFECH